ncbi:hypothetical protein [Bradyrhizobium sp. USDA 336]|uniref:hypothetical protein n=1 Tax=Bradyrhizobium sp. USDA 336 TaxID=3156311 RepID=UPI0038326835
MSLQIYAPSLRSLPEDAMLVMATLPVIDWNNCLLRDLHIIKKRTPVPAYAAIVMIDPFACWEDFADLLKNAEITGIINFPPASILERSSGGVPVDTGQELELRRMEWVRKPRVQGVVRGRQRVGRHGGGAAVRFATGWRSLFAPGGARSDDWNRHGAGKPWTSGVAGTEVRAPGGNRFKAATSNVRSAALFEDPQLLDLVI